MQSVKPLGVRVETVWAEVAVTSDWGGDGEAVANTTDSISVTLRNVGDFSIEYQIDSDAWTRLELRNSIALDVSLATTTIRFRKSQFGGVGVARLEIESLTDYYVVDGHAVELGGGGAFTDLTDASSVDLPSINEPLTQALAGKADARRVLAADDFFRANENPLASPWVVPSGMAGFKIVSHVAQVITGDTQSFVYHNGVEWPADQWSKVVLTGPAGTGSNAPAVRINSTGSYNLWTGAGGVLELYRTTFPGTFTLLTNFARGSYQGGDSIELRAVHTDSGELLTVYYNDNPIIRYLDNASTHLSGAPGLYGYTGSAGVLAWEGGAA